MPDSQTPVHIAVGDLDFAARPAAALAEILPDAHLTVLEGANHNAFPQSIDAFMEVVDQALANE